MSQHLILVSDGRRYDVDDEPVEDGAFLRFEWNGASHRIPLNAIRDVVTFPDAPGPNLPAGADTLRGREVRPAGGPEPSVSSAQAREETAPTPAPTGAGVGAPSVGQVVGQERELPRGHPANAGGAQMVEVRDEQGRTVLVPMSDDGLAPSDTEYLS